MNVSRLGMAIDTNERARARTTELTERDAASERFAATLAGALTAHAHAPPRARPAESSASSELDHDDEIRSSDARDESAASDRAAAARRESVAEPVKPKETSATEPAAALGAAASGLDARLQQKLTRVVSRMKSEFGRDVAVVEGVRSQQRQEQLFAQGRTTAGPVVTWTHHSLHTPGRAADVTIDGGYEDAAGFALLRQVAEAEGLHTLGARDPGHLELRGARGAGIVGALAQALPPAPARGMSPSEAAPGDARTPWVVQGPLIATVAAVATVATVARVARVVAPGAPSRGEAAPSASPAAPATAAVLLAAKRNGASDQGGHAGSGARDSRQQREGTPLAAASDVRAGERAYGAMDRSSAGGSMDAPLVDASGDVRASSATRAADALDAREAAAPRTLARLTLSLDDGLGGQDHVRIGMRGTSVGASFDIRDANSADRVASRMGELTRALEQRGLEPQSLQVRSSVSREAELGRTATQTTDALRSVATTSAPRTDARADSGSDARQRFTQHDEQHERARREQDEQRRRDSTFFLNTETT